MTDFAHVAPSNFEVQAIEETKRKIWKDITRRRNVLGALAFVVQTDFLISMGKLRRDLMTYQ